MAFAKRTGRDCFGHSSRYITKGPWRDILKWNKSARERGVRERVFCGSMMDIGEFNTSIDEVRREALRLMAGLTNLDCLLLTKRPDNLGFHLREMFGRKIPDHFCIGCTAENQANADRRLPELFAIPARVRFVSIEPMLGPIDLWKKFRHPSRTHKKYTGKNPEPFVDWVIAGGESGPHARPVDPNWIRSLRNQCGCAEIPFMFKQWGEWAPNCECGRPRPCREIERPESRGVMFRCDKNHSGRELDGVEHMAFPNANVRRRRIRNSEVYKPMKEHGILFKPEMVLAEQSGRKTMTSRIITAHNSTVDGHGGKSVFENLNFEDAFVDHSFREEYGSYLRVAHKSEGSRHRVRARIEKGDRLWIRENWRPHPRGADYVQYQADNAIKVLSTTGEGMLSVRPTWKPSIHLPRKYARTILEVLDVFPYRIQDITEEECKAEGAEPRCECCDGGLDPEFELDEQHWPCVVDDAAQITFKHGFRLLWDSINGEPRADGVDISWAANPWVWGYKFRRVE
jgi:protein gp37